MFLRCIYNDYNYGNLEGLFLGESLEYTDGKVIGSNEGKKMGLSGGKMLGKIPGDVYGITLGLDVGTYLDSLDVSFDSSNDGKLKGIFHG